MCGIFACINYDSELHSDSDLQRSGIDYKNLLEKTHNAIKHRGPDVNGNMLLVKFEKKINVLLYHSRLRINGNYNAQPIVNKEKNIYLIINGEIFNWKQLENELDYKCVESDCEILIPLYTKYKNDIPTFFSKLQGQFSFVLYDTNDEKILIGRDPIGVTPMYYALNKKDKKFLISSEMKCFNDFDIDTVNIFEPRTYIYTDTEKLINMDFQIQNYMTFNDYIIDTEKPNKNFIEPKLETINSLLTASVKSQLLDLLDDTRDDTRDNTDDDIDFGLLLSGGLDSSLISSLVCRIAKEHGYNKKIKTFSIGVDKNAPDLVAARKVSQFLNTEHYEYTFSIDEGLKSLVDVIWYIESYDCTSIRASTPMYLLTKKIKADFPKLKVLFSGELSDELFCYLYGANAPSMSGFQNETIELVSNVHKFDCLRANKTCMANSIEVRVPFTDINFVNYILSIHPSFKMFGKNNRMEKQLLRDAFVGDYLPNDILYRKKEQFSDGVSGFNGKENNWIDGIAEYVNNLYSLEEFNNESEKYEHNKPLTKEQLFFRDLFTLNFNNTLYEKTVSTWIPKWSKTTDPSGRVQDFWSEN